MRNPNSSTLSLPPRPESRTRSTSTPNLNLLNEKLPTNGRRLSTRPSLPDVTTASPTYTAGRNFPSEFYLQNSINWNAVQSRPIFEGPPTFQKLALFLNSPSTLKHVHPVVRQQINSPEHILHLQRCWTILKRGSKEELQNKFGMPEKVGDLRFEIYKMWVMVRLAWRIVQALKNAKGSSRISEIGEWALYVIEMNKQVSPTKSDPIPLLTLACSLTYPHPSMSLLSKTREKSTPLTRNDRDIMALQYFEEGFQQPNDSIANRPSNIYGKAHYAKLLRRLTRNGEAETIEEEIRTWWLGGGRSLMSKARMVDLVCHEGESPSESPVLRNLDGFRSRSRDSARDSGIDVSPSPSSLKITLHEHRDGGDGPYPRRDGGSSNGSTDSIQQLEEPRPSRSRSRIAV